MGYHHLALAAKDMKATHDFYERIMGFELVKVEVGPIPGGGWGKHFFYRIDGDDSRFIAFWELHETAGQENYQYDLNEAAGLPPGTNHYSFTVDTLEELAGVEGPLERRRAGRAGDRPQLVPLGLHARPERQHGRVLRHHRQLHAGRP
jgi:catechol 2,3-dioxygenase-like lactoylglutathione lyase family enzyme